MKTMEGMLDKLVFIWNILKTCCQMRSKKLSDYVENIFNVILCGFRKAHSTQHALFKLLQSCQKELDEKGMVATVLMDLTLSHMIF